ncbi:MAG: hypothetical protein NVSMB6_03490 [Burkholderiaceae bacterium]
MLVSLVLTTGAHAANSVLGGGLATCAGYMGENESARDMRGAWVLGYLSGLNAKSKADFLGRTDFPSIHAALDLYCKENPLDQLFDAADSIFTRLAAKTKARKKTVTNDVPAAHQESDSRASHTDSAASRAASSGRKGAGAP